jgi:phosphate:Na+ symporter
LENEASERHLRALRGGGGGDVYLRILRDLKRIHSHLAALAYPPLERAGLLQGRLTGGAAMSREAIRSLADTDV